MTNLVQNELLQDANYGKEKGHSIVLSIQTGTAGGSQNFPAFSTTRTGARFENSKAGTHLVWRNRNRDASSVLYTTISILLAEWLMLIASKWKCVILFLSLSNRHWPTQHQWTNNKSRLRVCCRQKYSFDILNMF